MAARCYNKNTAEYKALQNKFNKPIFVDSIISKWQKSNNSDLIPTVQQVDKFLNQQKTMLSLKKREYADAVLANLSNAKLVSKFNGEYYINVTEPGQIQRIDRKVAELNRVKALRLLKLWGVNPSAITMERTDKTYRVDINPDIFTRGDLIAQDNSKNHTHVLDILEHMMDLFPQLNIKVASVSEAREYYDNLSEEQKRKVPFEQINSYYVRGTVMIIKGRVTPETAIEEVLHPFVDAVYLENRSLFNGLLKEAREMFPQLRMEIDAEYNSKRGFSVRDRDLELVTQALSRHFKKEYENEPTSNWRSKIAQLLKFLLDVIQDLSSFVTGERLGVSASMLNSNNTLSSIAKLLNTQGLEFKFTRESVLDTKVKYSLTPKLDAAVKRYKEFANTPIQKQIIDNLFHTAINNKEVFPDFTAGSPLTGTETPLVILDKETHTYKNVETLEEYGSTTTKIKGKLNDPEDKYKINRDIGNDFDLIMEFLALQEADEAQALEILLPQMKVLDRDSTIRAIAKIENKLLEYREAGAVIIPQVVVADAASKTAGTIDLLAINEDGTLQIIDLKVSKNSIKTDMYDRLFPVNEGSIFYDPTLKDKDQFGLTTRMQQGLQVNTYRRMLTNMGYTVDPISKTIHFHVDVTGKDQNQKFEGTFRLDGEVNHPSSQALTFVDQIVPLNPDMKHKETMEEEPYVTEEEALPQDDVLEEKLYSAQVETVKQYKERLVTRREVLEQLLDREKQTIFSKNLIDNIDRAITDINVAIMEGRADVVYEELLQQNIEELKQFIEYVNTGDKTSSEYIDMVLKMEDIALTYAGLDIVALPEGMALGNKKEALRNTLKDLVDQIRGDGVYTNKGLVDEGIYQHVREFYLQNTNRTDLTKEELDKIMTEMEDMGTVAYGTSDLATSRDPLSQMMDKLYKRQVQKVIDKVEERNRRLRALGSKLEKLSPGGKVDFKFMLNFDSQGNFKGTYVDRIGPQYDALFSEVRSLLTDDRGEWKEYIVKSNLEDYTKEELQYNKELKEARRKFAQLMSAEDVVDGRRVDGKYHRYTPEFIRARDQVLEYHYSADNTFGWWQPKKSVSATKVTEFYRKYYQENVVTKVNEDGSVSQVSTKKFPKREYVEKRTTSRGGKLNDMMNPKYEKIMNPDPTDSLALAQKEFYLFFVQEFLSLLDKLPSSVRDQMIGRVPVVRDNTLTQMKKEGSLIAGLTSRASRGFKNLFTTTSRQEKVLVDEQGQILDTLPIFYVGRPQDEKLLESIDKELQLLESLRKEQKIKADEYNQKKAELTTRRNDIQSRPKLNEMSLDMVDNLLRFSAMAENYEVMNEIKGTLLAFQKVIENRNYSPSGTSRMFSKIKGKKATVGMKEESNIASRARKWMHMVYYNNDRKTEGFLDKVSRNLIQLSSLTYVGLNWWGNINNYAMGRMNNAIETIGGRYFEPEAMLRATKEFQGAALSDIVKKMGSSSTWAGLTGGKGKYQEYIPESKYNGLVGYFRMMDDNADLREQAKAKGKGGLSREVMSWAYMFQDGAEYNVQTKVGMAVLMSTKMQKLDDKGNVLDEMSLFDALQYNNKTGDVTLKEGYDTMVKRNGRKVKFDDNARYDLRNYIREVNKQIHGNYAYVDRTVIQQHFLGQLAMQFKKWVAPAIKARYRKEYYDENLGWMEGRYRSAISFMAYFFKESANINKTVKRMKHEYGDERAMNKIQGMKRTIGDFAFIMASFAMAMILDSLFDDDDDDKSVHRKRFENALVYQFNRQARELMFFIPVLGTKEQFFFTDSPIAVTRMMGDMGDAMLATLRVPLAYSYQLANPDYDIKADKNIYYQRGTRKGTMKVAKEWMDVMPLLYTINRYKSYDTVKDFWVK